MGVGGQHHAPAALPPGKTRYPLYRSLRGPQGRSGRVRVLKNIYIHLVNQQVNTDEKYFIIYSYSVTQFMQSTLTMVAKATETCSWILTF